MTKGGRKRKSSEKTSTADSADASTSQEQDCEVPYDEIDRTDLAQCQRFSTSGDNVCGMCPLDSSLPTRCATILDLLLEARFDTSEQFDEWRTGLQANGSYRWRRTKGTSRHLSHMAGKVKHETYRCDMVSEKVSGWRTKSRPYTCSCYIHAFIQPDNSVYIRYSLTHYGHTVPLGVEEHVVHVEVESGVEEVIESVNDVALSVVIVDDGTMGEEDIDVVREGGGQCCKRTPIRRSIGPSSIAQRRSTSNIVSPFFAKFKRSSTDGHEGEQQLAKPMDTSPSMFSPAWYERARHSFETAKEEDSLDIGGVPSPGVSLTQQTTYETDDGVLVAYPALCSEPVSNLYRPFSHNLVDDVERWTREEKHVHDVINEIIKKYPMEILGRTETSLRQLIKRVRRERGLKGMAFVPWEMRKQLQADGRVRAKERRDGGEIGDYQQEIHYSSPVDDFASSSRRTPRTQNAAAMLRRLDEREELAQLRQLAEQEQQQQDIVVEVVNEEPIE